MKLHPKQQLVSVSKLSIVIRKSHIKTLGPFTVRKEMEENMMDSDRVKSGIFGQTAKFGQRPCLFHISNIGIKNKLTRSKQ